MLFIKTILGANTSTAKIRYAGPPLLVYICKGLSTLPMAEGKLMILAKAHALGSHDFCRASNWVRYTDFSDSAAKITNHDMFARGQKCLFQEKLAARVGGRPLFGWAKSCAERCREALYKNKIRGKRKR
jgi:hypothetical protein